MAKKVLVVDDEKLIVKGLRFSLEQDDMEVDCAYDGEEAVQKARENEYDIILLDLMLPKLDGFGVCEWIRARSDVPVVMLTALDGEEEQLRGYDLRIDDYVTKPFSMPLLLRKIAAILRRCSDREERRVLTYRDLTLDLDAYGAERDGRDLELTNREFILLRTLLENKNVAMSREKLLCDAWGYDYYGETNIIDVYVRYIRHKTSDDVIKTIRGVGYIISDS